jgi:hypothetical protein
VSYCYFQNDRRSLASIAEIRIEGVTDSLSANTVKVLYGKKHPRSEDCRFLQAVVSARQVFLLARSSRAGDRSHSGAGRIWRQSPRGGSTPAAVLHRFYGIKSRQIKVHEFADLNVFCSDGVRIGMVLLSMLHRHVDLARDIVQTIPQMEDFFGVFATDFVHGAEKSGWHEQVLTVSCTAIRIRAEEGDLRKDSNFTVTCLPSIESSFCIS